MMQRTAVLLALTSLMNLATVSLTPPFFAMPAMHCATAAVELFGSDESTTDRSACSRLWNCSELSLAPDEAVVWKNLISAPSAAPCSSGLLTNCSVLGRISYADR